MAKDGVKDRTRHKSNFDVDYVIHYRIPATDQEAAEAEAAFTQLVKEVSDVGFATEVRNGGKSSLLVFVKIASDKLLAKQIYRYRVQDWLYGVRTSAPNQDLEQYFKDEPVTDAERLRLAYLLITKPKNEGGAGITPQVGAWKYVASIFPLHDRDFNRQWIKQWSTKYYLDSSDIDQIRDRFGERVAFYFAFLQSYFTFLLFPAAFGFASWLLLGQFSWFYALVNCLWSVVFFEHWKMKEVDLAVQWGVRGVSKIQLPRSKFQFDHEAQDPVTGEIIRMYSPFKRFARQLLQAPFALACFVVLGTLIVSCFSIEIFITEIYNGPFKQYLTFLPTILLTIFTPTLTTLLTKLAERLTEMENYETKDAHQASFVQKIFVLNFITSYSPIFLTAFVYVPFGKILVPYLDVFQLTAQKFTTEGKPLPTKAWEINPDRLTKQVIYFTVTAQIVNFVTEVIVPYAKRKMSKAVEEVHSEISSEKKAELRVRDVPEEHEFLGRVREEAELDEYDVTVDYREMVIQFGYLSLFSVVWPLTACSFLVNNWVEARSDAMKIAISSQRPIPWRADSIGPWLNSLGFLSWLGSVTSAALVFLFHQSQHGPDGSPWDISGWALLLSILFSEHVYLVVQRIVRSAVHLMDSPGLQKERAERFAMRKQLLEQTFSQDLTEESHGPGLSGGEKITREALEEEARRISIKGNGTPEEQFWQRQRGASETIQIGRSLISEQATANITKSQK
ncbi:calcium-activated chloride channel-domain-containing protein [Lasiosphaeria miniovina]|uniref:Calcium-activated chloride channel-domain-containing protein n=1 Tax=Lasiosphaeria miniovina TaxID=1954250 RepID=A0AA40ALY8_9PEZI|nr:calcium-activated chloride channel-domain-containing protein [Lasiosphaeria miniovina]KAK0718298.1 calcium-activated chloride channel-domain-containing protein [Lasiosphaeria miniovina]